MDAVVVAAGRGTRMRPLTDTRPKPLLPVGRQSLLERTLDQCVGLVDRFVIVVGYRGEMIRERVGEAYAGVPVEYVDQTERLGTAHAIGQAAEVVSGSFLALNGDVVVDRDLIEQLAAADGHALAVTTVADPTAYGVVETEDGTLQALHEKPADPPSNRVNVGLYAFEPSAFGAIERTEKSARGEYEITDAIEGLLADGEAVTAVEYDGTWLDVGRPWEVLSATEAVLSDLEGGIEGTVEDGAHLHGPVVVEAGARVRSGAYVEGPVVVRSGADVGPNAYLRGATVIGPDARVGNAVEVKNSVLLEGATVGHLSYVGDSVLGGAVNFGAGTIVANLRHDDESVRLTVKGERVDTGRRKLGVVVGDGAKTGIDTSLNAGVKLRAGARTKPGEDVLRDRT
jgi:UDP-N-acetylglucosamine diphosphorylase/glucosamine-1-phosphate N-acetyltransferase